MTTKTLDRQAETLAAPADLLDRAADVIASQGWIVGATHDVRSALPPTSSPCCTVGAIRVAAGHEPDDGAHDPIVLRTLAALRRWLEETEKLWPLTADPLMCAHSDPYCYECEVAEWNDRQRDGARVVAELRAAAAYARLNAPRPS